MTAPAFDLRTSSLAAAYDHCEAVTRRASSNFYWGFRLLPHDRRRALCAVYAFCRSADDIADEPGAARNPARLLARWRAELDAVYRGRPQHRMGIALADTAERFAVPREHFEEPHRVGRPGGAGDREGDGETVHYVPLRFGVGFRSG